MQKLVSETILQDFHDYDTLNHAFYIYMIFVPKQFILVMGSSQLPEPHIWFSYRYTFTVAAPWFSVNKSSSPGFDIQQWQGASWAICDSNSREYIVLSDQACKFCAENICSQNFYFIK